MLALLFQVGRLVDRAPPEQTTGTMKALLATPASPSAVAAFTMAFKRGTALAGLLTGALALLGGVWFPIALLPGAVRWVAQLLPLTWGVAALRDCLLSGHLDVLRLTWLLVSGVVVLGAALWLFGAPSSPG